MEQCERIYVWILLSSYIISVKRFLDFIWRLGCKMRHWWSTFSLDKTNQPWGKCWFISSLVSVITCVQTEDQDLPWWLLLIADWLTLGREERGGSLRIGGIGRLLDRSSLGWKFPTAYTPCIGKDTNPHVIRMSGPKCLCTVSQIHLQEHVTQHSSSIFSAMLDRVLASLQRAQKIHTYTYYYVTYRYYYVTSVSLSEDVFKLITL